MDVNKRLKEIIHERGLKLTYVANMTGIKYQRLNRLFNQNASMLATEFIVMCRFLEINPNVFCDRDYGAA